MRPTLLFLSFLFLAPAHACINMTERVPGVLMEHVEFYALGSVKVDRDSLDAFIRQRTAGCSKGPGTPCNDLVIAHLFAKDFKAALELSTRLVGKYPDDYSVVITHAAALELNGKPAEAIPFMKHALELEPKSHKGSEWIHLNLLQLRVQGEAGVDPWKLIGVDLRPSGTLTAPAGTDVKALLRQVHYQVNDRLFFTPTDDRLFGALMLAYADLLELNGYASQAKRMCERSTNYGYVFGKDTQVGAADAHEEAALQEAPPAAAATASVTDTLPSEDALIKNSGAEPTSDGSKASMYAWLLIAAIVAVITGFIWRNSRPRPH